LTATSDARVASFSEPEGTDDLPTVERRRPERRPELAFAAIALLGLVATALGVVLAVRTDRSNERRLLQVQTEQAATVLASATSSIQEPMASALDVAASVLPWRRREVFKQRFVRSVGPDRTFQVGALWSRGPGGFTEVAAIGGQAGAAPASQRARDLLARALSSGTMAVHWAIEGRQTRISFALADPVSGFVVYTERVLPAGRRVPVDPGTGFAGLDYAIYLGDAAMPANLATTDVDPSSLPLTGLTFSTTVPFGDSTLTLVTRPRDHLGSDLGRLLPWLVGFGVPLLTALALALARQVLLSRERAEADTRTITTLFRRVDKLYGEQRELSVRLQRALLPRTIPTLPGFEVAAAYVAGAQGIDIGGDWYSVIGFGDDRFAFVVGDVSGHGIDTVAEMARARFTVRAYLVDGDSPQVALEKCSHQFDITTDGHMVTVVAGVGSWRTGELVIASAGHPPPLLLSPDGSTEFVPVEAGGPLGVGPGTYQAATVTLTPGATLLCYTDGLVERRTEDIDAGFARLARAAASDELRSGPLEPFLGGLLETMRDPERHDDIAVLALRRAPEHGGE
jgi:serine phosphatase RsbU (regulator of sigma subunit)